MLSTSDNVSAAITVCKVSIYFFTICSLYESCFTGCRRDGMVCAGNELILINNIIAINNNLIINGCIFKAKLIILSLSQSNRLKICTFVTNLAFKVKTLKIPYIINPKFNIKHKLLWLKQNTYS